MTSFVTPHCISLYVINKTKREPLYLLIRRAGKYLPGTWQMVSGGILEGERAAQAALRELHEETGLTPKALYNGDLVETFYMQSLDKITFVPVFVAFVEETKVTLSPTEHDAYEWLPFEEARSRLVWSEQRRVIEAIHKNFIEAHPNDLLIADTTVKKEKTITSRTGVYGVVFKDDTLLVVKQNHGPHAGKFDLPGGGIEPLETVETALRREFLEEVGMTFEKMTLLDNFSASVEWINEQKLSVSFHQVGLIYLVEGLALLPHQSPELAYFWLSLDFLRQAPTSPFLAQALSIQLPSSSF
ncbi:MAG: NUDIX domain-containing protein [Verrucomicrobia bacterium]|nr:NUDIX domain-containing protein [Verrucomicrobiota bacterium]